MALAAKLQDVELQLQRVTQAVQLHAKLTDAAVKVKGPPELDPGVLTLVNRVERAQSDLHDATTRLLALAKCDNEERDVDEECVNGDTETEDEMEDQVCVNVDDLETEENPADFLVNAQPDRRSSLEKYTFLAKNAVKMVIDPEDAETVEAWRRIVEVNGLDANKEFLEQLSEDKVEEEVAVAYSKATTFAVSVLTSYQAMSQKPSWLMQLVEDLTDVQNAAKDTDLARVLSPVEKCRDDLIVYCSRSDRDALDDMSNYVVLIERHRGVQANRLLPYLLTLYERYSGQTLYSAVSAIHFENEFLTGSDPSDDESVANGLSSLRVKMQLWEFLDATCSCYPPTFVSELWKRFRKTSSFFRSISRDP